MIKKVLSVGLMAIIAFLSISGLVVRASDVDDCQYLTRIVVTNNGSTTATSEAVSVNMTTPATITAGLIASNASDGAVRLSGGTDVPFGMGVNASDLMMIFVPTITAGGQVDNYFYSLGCSGGQNVYFPAKTGATIEDDASLEGSGNFSVHFVGGISDEGTSNITAKSNFILSIDAGVIQIGSSDWTTPPTMTTTGWTNGANANDDDTGTFARDNVPASSWSAYMQSNFSAMTTTSYRYWFAGGSGWFNNTEIDLYASGSWVNVYSGTPDPRSEWNTKTFAETENVTAVRQRFYNNNGGSAQDADFYETDTYIVATIQTPAIASGNVTVDALMSTGNTTIVVNGTQVATSTTSVVLTDASDNWTFYSTNSTNSPAVIYMESQEIRVGGNQKAFIDWKYSTTFDDDSGNGNDMTPTFRTTSTDPNVTTSVISQVALIDEGLPTASTGTGWTMITANPTAPVELNREGGQNYPGGAEIKGMADDTNTDYMLWATIFSFGTAIALGAKGYSMTRNQRTGSQGSMFVMWLIITVVQTMFVIGGNGVIAGWTIIPPSFVFIFIMVWMRTGKTTPV